MIAICGVAILSFSLCGFYLRLATRWRLVDHPNARSSHSHPTPHGGGLPLFIALIFGFVAMGPWPIDYWWMMATALFLLALGVLDDLRGLPSSLRFVLYGVVAVVSVGVLFRDGLQPFGVEVGLVLAVMALGTMWLINLYNFMDGIDGLAAVQCILACLGALVLASNSPEVDRYLLFCGLLAASHLGFLYWNWAPAKVFMGDAGSIPTGFLLAMLAIYGTLHDLLPLSCWLILLAVFIVDATATLCWRITTGQPFTQAHRLHAYQRLSRHWGSHRRVVLLLIGIFVFWLFPLAWLVEYLQSGEVYFVTLAYFPLLFCVAKISKFP